MIDQKYGSSVELKFTVWPPVSDEQIFREELPIVLTPWPSKRIRGKHGRTEVVKVPQMPFKVVAFSLVERTGDWKPKSLYIDLLEVQDKSIKGDPLTRKVLM